MALLYMVKFYFPGTSRKIRRHDESSRELLRCPEILDKIQLLAPSVQSWGGLIGPAGPSLNRHHVGMDAPDSPK
jgi:hypothetical protein